MRKILLLFCLTYMTMSYAFVPSECSHFLHGQIKDSYNVEDLIGMVFQFVGGESYNRYSSYCFKEYPDTIIVHHKKKMEVDVDYFVVEKFGAELQYKEKKATWYSKYQTFNPLTYDEKHFKKYDFAVTENNIKETLYGRKFKLLAVLDAGDINKLLFEDVVTHKKMIYKPSSNITTEFVPCELEKIVMECFPDTLYTTSLQMSPYKRCAIDIKGRLSGKIMSVDVIAN